MGTFTIQMIIEYLVINSSDEKLDIYLNPMNPSYQIKTFIYQILIPSVPISVKIDSSYYPKHRLCFCESLVSDDNKITISIHKINWLIKRTFTSHNFTKDSITERLFPS